MISAAFALQTFLVSLSGVMAPGPISATAIGQGSKTPLAGLLISLGHAVIELPLIIALYFGFGAVLEIPLVKPVLALVGGALLLYLSAGMFVQLRRALSSRRGRPPRASSRPAAPRQPVQQESSRPAVPRQPILRPSGRQTHADRAVAEATKKSFVSGVLLSAGNPYFLLWWATVGAALVLRAAEFGAVGFAAFVVIHWGCDAAWLSVLSGLSYGGTRRFGWYFETVSVAVCAVFLSVVGVTFFVDAARILTHAGPV